MTDKPPHNSDWPRCSHTYIVDVSSLSIVVSSGAVGITVHGIKIMLGKYRDNERKREREKARKKERVSKSERDKERLRKI